MQALPLLPRILSCFSNNNMTRASDRIWRPPGTKLQNEPPPPPPYERSGQKTGVSYFMRSASRGPGKNCCLCSPLSAALQMTIVKCKIYIMSSLRADSNNEQFEAFRSTKSSSMDPSIVGPRACDLYNSQNWPL